MSDDPLLMNIFITEFHGFLTKFLLDKDEEATLIEKDDCLDLVITAPAESKLTLTAEVDELTLFYENYHIHLDLVRGGKIVPEDAKEVLHLVSGILTGESMLIAKYKGGKWTGGSLIGRNYGQYEEIVLKELPGHDYVTLKSWHEKLKRIDGLEKPQ